MLNIQSNIFSRLDNMSTLKEKKSSFFISSKKDQNECSTNKKNEARVNDFFVCS
jgi:hypothetical protein